MSAADRLRFRASVFWKRLHTRRKEGWNGLSILVFREDSGERPTTFRINYYILIFLGALVIAVPTAGVVLAMQRSLTAADASRVVENRRSLLNLMSQLTREKERLIGQVEDHIGEFQQISHADAGVLARGVDGPPPRPAERANPATDRMTYDLALLQRMNRQADQVLGTDAYNAMELIWNRMTLHYIMPRGRPLPAGVGFITSVFGRRPNPFQRMDTGPSEVHTGVDFAAAQGTPLVATAPGIVVRAMRDNDGYGNHVRIHHGFGITSLYAHCQDIAVEEGQYVRRGQLIGWLGHTGRATGNHVHFEVQLGLDPQIDPMEFIQLK